jgi:hypothetical protein
MQIVDKREVALKSACTKKVLLRAIDSLTDRRVNIAELVTDASTAVIATISKDIYFVL